MAGRLNTSTTYEQRSVVRFLWSQGKPANVIHQEMTVAYGISCMAVRTVRWWCQQFGGGRETVADEERSGRPCTASTDRNIALVDELVKANRRLHLRDIADTVGISYGAVHDIMHVSLGYRKVSARWVPKRLDAEQMGLRMSLSLDHLERYNREGNDFLHRIVTGDESWVFHFTPESKQQSMIWKHPDSPPPKKFRVTATTKKVMLTLFFDCKGPVLVNFTPHGSTITAVSYCDVLRRLRRALRDKRPGGGPVILLHDNARPHTANASVATVRQFGWELLPHPPYSPDLAPCDFHVFGPLKRYLAGQRFTSDDDVMGHVRQWFRDQPTDFFRQGIEKLVPRWDRCAEKLGDYVEK